MSARSSNGIKKLKAETSAPDLEEESEDESSHSIASSESRSVDSDSESGSVSASASGPIEEVSSEEEGEGEGDEKEKVTEKDTLKKSAKKLKSKAIITKKSKDILVTPKRKTQTQTQANAKPSTSDPHDEPVPREEPVPLKISVEKSQYDNMHFMLSEIGDGDISYVRSIVITPENKIQTTEKLKANEDLKVHRSCIAVFFRDLFSSLGVMTVDKKGNVTPYATKIIPMEYRKKFEMYKITHTQQKGTKKGELGRLYVPLECMQKIVKDMENGAYAKAIKNNELRFEFDSEMKKKWDNLVEEGNKVCVRKSKSGNIPKSFVRDRTHKSGNIEIQGRLIKDITMDLQGSLINSCNHLMNVSVNQPFTDLLKKVKAEIITCDRYPTVDRVDVGMNAKKTTETQDSYDDNDNNNGSKKQGQKSSSSSKKKAVEKEDNDDLMEE